ncbi:MAG TPA: hypothetical protein VHB54_18390 [Mucilaginibacter sp.]|nr:hypothetical protein [Mucilaginibacter sp.]
MKNLFLCIIFLFTISHLQAQQKPNFTGTFTLDKAKTDFDDLPEYVLPISFKIVQSGNNLTITRTTVTDQGVERNFTETIILGGDSVKSVIPGGLHRTSIAAWNNDQMTFTIKSDSRSADHTAGLKLTEVWSLTDEGNTLEVDRDVLQADGGAYQLKAFYEKNN